MSEQKSGAKRQNQKPTGRRRKTYTFRLEPMLMFHLQGLAQAHGVSVAALLAKGARAELAKVQEDPRGTNQA